jgi:cytochrome bd ubiquinol oxidase subunit II
MSTVWFLILAGLLIGYAMLDGFDLGVGALHLWLARTDEEHRTLLNAIGPVWDGNEVWLIAWGAAFFLAFPRAFAVAFSGFYLPLMIALWLLMGRGIAIEFRHHVADPLWQGAWDVIFSLSSLLLAGLYGVAVGNVVTGAPLNEQGYFQGLFEWMLNPYALLMGLFSLTILLAHGAHYLSVKTTGALQARTRVLSARLWPVLVALAVAVTLATFAVRPLMLHNFGAAPVLLILPLLAAAFLALMRLFERRRADGPGFLCSCGLICSLLASTAIGLYPYVLLSEPHHERSLTIANAAASPEALSTAALWMIPGALLLVIYQVFVYLTFGGKVSLGPETHY